MRNKTERMLAGLRMRQFELLVAIADSGSMRAAAQRVNLTTAAVSKGLQDIEDLFEVEIFSRLPRGVAPTAKGDVIVHEARILLNHMTHLVERLEGPVGHADRLCIGTPPFLAWSLLPEALRTFCAGGWPVRIVEGRMADICGQLEAGVIDVLVTMNAPSELGGLRAEGFVIERFGSEQWVVLCAPTHPLAPRAGDSVPTTWSDLRKAHWILPPQPTHSRTILDQVFLTQGEAPVIPYIESMNAIANIELAERSLGVTFLAARTVAARLAAGTLVTIPVQPMPAAVPMSMVFPKQSANAEKIRQLRLALAAAARTPA